ncbi:hypothetical protein F5890DRAFT_1555386 [Lentinula detonsa]|uniref:Uncharacterized protein n=1 Tax=Lentinula detonsa TaxID=2804962 RepID=A0AA38USW2_9AGAR|nr:hypothetical protein F5890DRAFT_1555386 [Lentinula detonsa]
MVVSCVPVNTVEALARSYNHAVDVWEADKSSFNTVELAWAWYRINTVSSAIEDPYASGFITRAIPTDVYDCMVWLNPLYIRQLPSPVLSEAIGWRRDLLRQLCLSHPEPVFCYVEGIRHLWVVYFGAQGFYSHLSLTSVVEDILLHWYENPKSCDNDRWRLGLIVGDQSSRVAISREYAIGGIPHIWNWFERFD